MYVSKDIRVGDTVRVVGRINEWPRQRQGGQKEWVREVVVDEGSGGSIGKSREPLPQALVLHRPPLTNRSCA